MRAPVPPCEKDCPRRRACPSCHNRDYCEAWGKFEDAAADYKAERQKMIDAEKDIQGFYKASLLRNKKRAWIKE